MRLKNIYILENWMEKPDLLMKKSLSNCNVNELKVLWISSGSAEPLHSLRSMLLSIGPSHTFKMSWATSVSKTIKCRLQRESRSTICYSLNTITKISKQSFPNCAYPCDAVYVWRRAGGPAELLIFLIKDAIFFSKCLDYRKHPCQSYSTISIHYFYESYFEW